MITTIDFSTRTIQRDNFDHHYSAECFVNPQSYDFHRSTWGNRKPVAYVILNAGFVAAIVFPEYYSYSEQDALDEAADSGKLDFLQVSESELKDYQTGTDSEGYPEYEGIVNLGNASEPFDQENLEMFTVPVSLFLGDAVIIDVIAASSRDEAIERLQDALKAEQAEPVSDDLDAFHILNRAIDYLRTPVER